jgi:ligand-binding sensor domain-containing protein/two-component sensor histidine kinase
MINRILSLVLISLSFSSSIDAQVYYVKDYTTSDGLVQGTVKSIFQDSKGRMWFGTAEGVSIYDGTEFINYSSNEGFSRPVITSFYELQQGIMLVGTLGDGLVVFSDPPFSKPKLQAKIKDKNLISGIYISQIIPDQEGNVWFCTEEGLTIWRMKENKIVSVDSITTFGKYGKLSLFQIEFYDDKNFYAATNSGLFKKSNSSYEIIKYKGKEINEPVFKLFMDSKRILWFATLNDLFFIKNNTVRNIKEVYPDFKEPVYCIAEDKDKSIYLGSIDGLIRLFDNKFIHLDKNNGLQKKDIISLYLDDENNLWVGSLSGISKLNGSNFSFVNTRSFKGHFNYILKEGKKLFTTSSEGLFEIDNYSLKKSELTKGIPTKVINHYSKDDDYNYWFSTDKGLYRKKQNEIIHYSTNNGLPHNFIYQTAVDKKNIVWIATQRGLAYIKEDRVYNFENHLEKNWSYSDNISQNFITTQSIRRVAVDKNNDVWIGSWNGGLFRIHNDSVYRFSQKDGLTDLSIRGIQIDAQNNIWVSTRYGGVVKFDGKTFSKYDTENGLQSNWVFSVETDYNQNLWFCTAKGLTKHDGYKSITYDASDGITSAEIISSTKLGGKLWFLSNSQIFSYEPEKTINPFSYPKILFRQVKLIDGNLPSTDSALTNIDSEINSILTKSKTVPLPVELEYYQNSIVFDFAGIDFRDERRITYEFILDGFDKQWIKASKKNYITYTHLPPGKYSFKVNAINKEGLKSISPAVFDFNILTPFWQRWWFITISVVFFILLISLVNYLIYQYKIRQALRLERLRSNISTDLHDEIGTSLSSIAIFAELVKRENANGSFKNSDMLERIENTSRDLIDKMSDIVWAISPGNDKFEDALLKLKDYSVKILESRGINVILNLETNNDKIILPMDVRRNLLSIFKEVVTNAAKYSKASTVKIELKFIEKPETKIFLSIEDDGIGFDLNKHMNGYGLKNIKHRSDEIKAKLELNSSPGKGTSTKVEIPVL